MKRIPGFVFGLMVLGHAVFLVVANVGRQLDLQPVQAACTPWEAVTGNEQGWPLFTRGLMPDAVFPEVEIEYADGSTLVARPLFEPNSPTAVRMPIVGNRLFNHAVHVTLDAEYFSPALVETRPNDFRRVLHESAIRKRTAYARYLDHVHGTQVHGSTATRLTLRIRRYVNGEFSETLPWFRLTASTAGRRAEWYNLVDRRWEALESP